MKPKHQRLAFVTASMVFIVAAVLFTLQAFKNNIVFFYSPSDVVAQKPAMGRAMRLGGLVAEGSLVHESGQKIHFAVTDGQQSITVDYDGLLPNLFREGQGVVAQGTLSDETHFHATTILAKHDESYMPREVVDTLKKNGRWKGEGHSKP